MSKANPGAHGENKTERISALVTPTAKERLSAQAQSMNISLGELLERIARGQVPAYLSEQEKQLVGESLAS